MAERVLTTASLTRHCNELLILTVLEQEQKHGYQIARDIDQLSGGYFQFNHGTLYPILHKLEKSGCIKGRWKQEGPKRKRKYYTLTAAGRKLLKQLQDDWSLFFRTLFTLTGGAK